GARQRRFTRLSRAERSPAAIRVRRRRTGDGDDAPGGRRTADQNVVEPAERRSRFFRGRCVEGGVPASAEPVSDRLRQVSESAGAPAFLQRAVVASGRGYGCGG